MAGQKPRRVLIMTTIGKQLASRMMRASLTEKELYWELTLDPGRDTSIRSGRLHCCGCVGYRIGC